LARPALESLLGVQPARQAGTMGDYSTQGRLAARVRSQVGRRDYVRVRLERNAEGIAVHPVPGGSNAIRSMVDADGLLVVPAEREALEQGETVEVRLF
jgi:molybdopterin biosynthesis enzyme